MKLGQKVKIFIHLIVKIKKDDVFALASQLAYYLVLSFFPFMVFLMTLVGFSSLSSSEILDLISSTLPQSVVDLIRSTIMEIFDNQYTGLLGISILLMVWTSSSAFKAVIKSINKAYNIKENRSFILVSIISMLGILALALTILLALSALVFGNVIGEYIKNTEPFHEIMLFIWNAFRYTFILVIMVIIFIGIYKFAPAKKLLWREVIPGAIFSTIGWVLASSIFSFYIDNFNNYSKFYGSMGAVFVLMTWLFLISIIFILGVEINFVTSELNESKKY